MSILPEELWRQIMESGIGERKLTHRDLCSIAITCRRLNRLSSEPSLWSHLLSINFPPSPYHQTLPQQQHQHQAASAAATCASPKSSYKIRFEREREKKMAAWRRALLRKESEVFERERRIRELEQRLYDEREKMRCAAADLLNLHRVRQASVALNVWQPEVVRGRQEQILEQCAVPVESRVHSLEMELRLCKEQVEGLSKTYKVEKQRLEKERMELPSMKYNPLQDHKSMSSRDCNFYQRRKK